MGADTPPGSAQRHAGTAAVSSRPAASRQTDAKRERTRVREPRHQHGYGLLTVRGHLQGVAAGLERIVDHLADASAIGTVPVLDRNYSGSTTDQIDPRRRTQADPVGPGFGHIDPYQAAIAHRAARLFRAMRITHVGGGQQRKNRGLSDREQGAGCSPFASRCGQADRGSPGREFAGGHRRRGACGGLSHLLRTELGASKRGQTKRAKRHTQ